MKVKYNKETGIRRVYWPDGTPTRMIVLPDPFIPKLWCVYDGNHQRIVASYKTLSEANKAAKAMV